MSPVSRILQKHLRAIERDDLEALIRNRVVEDDRLELKGDLPAKEGRPDPWYSGEKLGDYARNQILRELIAFANAYGGTVVLGVVAKGNPGRAESLHFIPRCKDLAERLALQIRDCIRPTLNGVETWGVELEESGAGVVIIRIPQSLDAPHRLETTREFLVRRSHRSEVMEMREVHDLVVARRAMIASVEERFGRSRAELTSALSEFGERTGLPVTNGIKVAAIPLASLVGLPGLANRRDIQPYWDSCRFLAGGREQCADIPGFEFEARPTLRGLRLTSDDGFVQVQFTLGENGQVEGHLLEASDEQGRGVLFSWVIAMTMSTLLTVQRVRRLAGMPNLRYGVLIQIGHRPSGPIQFVAPRYGNLGSLGRWGGPELVLDEYVLESRESAADVTRAVYIDLCNALGRRVDHEVRFLLPEEEP
ncbi:MAG: putative DNA binding domain-containing protein [Anaerolineales bacterium]|nr:putative DNA binding domain-containing protein [Anaerolineales bacterium]